LKKKYLFCIIPDKMDKTIVVETERYETHPKYLKKCRFTKKYKVHDRENKYKEGDEVEFIETKPISKDKKFEVINH